MTVSDFRMTKRGQIAIYADGDFLMSVHPDVFAASGLSVGSEIDTERLEELAAEAALKKAKEKAFTLLSYQEMTAHQLEERLKRHVDEDTAAQAVNRMEELGLIDDDDYAQRYARDLSERKKFGILRVKQEMRRKGLNAEQIEFATSLLEEAPEEKIKAVIERKYPLAFEDEKVRRRAFAALMRLGYRSSDVCRVLNALSSGEDYGCSDFD